MKAKQLFLTCMMAGFGASPIVAQDYYDITDTYLLNSGFDADFDYPVTAVSGNVAQEILEVQGWTKNISVDYTITGVYQFGTPVTFNGAPIPTAGQDGNTDGGCLALSTGWGQSMLFYQSVTLPAGRYGLVSAFYNCGDKTTGLSRVGWIPTGKLSVLSSVNGFDCGVWTTDTVWFELDAVTAGKIQIGYMAGNNGSANSAKLALDFVKLLRDTPEGKADADILKEKLNDAVIEAKALYGDGSGVGADVLQEAIIKAVAVMDDDNATVAQVAASTEELNAAIDAYLWANPTGDVPVVTTDERYARGATMAFGRMSVSSAEPIVEQGFCWAENPEPTIADFTTTDYMENNGRIYRLDDLKPSTLYYMRAYAVTKGRQVGYGDVVKFYTIPKGDIRYTIRDGGDAATVKRITDAVEDAVGYWNNLTEIKNFTTSVGYDSGVATADCSYGGWIRVGSNTSYQATGTILHELLHGVGVIPWADTEWSRHNLRASVNGDGYGTGLWLGDRVTQVLRFWDNSKTAQLDGDYQHMWPYGINGAAEDNHTELLYIGNGLVCQALGEDGLQHTSSCFAQPYYAFSHEDGVKYYIKNESADYGLYSSYLISTEEGNLVWREMDAEEAVDNDSTAWTVTFTPDNQCYQFRNVATGRYMSYSANGTNGIKTVERTVPEATDNFQLMRGRRDVEMGTETIGQRGFWIIYPASNWTPRCLQAGASGITSAATFNIANSSERQRWLILSKEEMGAVENAALSGLKDEIGKALECLKKLVDVPHTEDVEGTDEAVNGTITAVEQALEFATKASDVTSLVDEVKLAIRNFLCNATPSNVSEPFDLTYMMSNPGMDSAEGWSVSPTVKYSCGEFYQTAFDMNQTLNGMPAGTYQLCAKAFQRPGDSSTSYADYTNGTNKVNTYLYAGSSKEKVAHIASEAQGVKLGGSELTVGGNRYVPNDMQSASIYFAKGLYENSVITTVAKDDSSLKLGISSATMSSYYWCIFDDFRLYFYGSMPKDVVTSIDMVETHIGNDDRHGIYTIDGRMLRKATDDVEGLPKGIYIVNGKKLVVK